MMQNVHQVKAGNASIGKRHCFCAANNIGKRKFLNFSLNYARYELFKETAAGSQLHVKT